MTMLGRARLRTATALGGALLAAACGGGGGGGVVSTPTPPPVITTPTPTPPTPVPTPTPTPTPSTGFNTAEYSRSNGATAMNAITAYNRGATGQGVTVAVVDSGVDIDSAEFAGRIHSASRDVASTRGVDDQDGHGTSVSGVLLAAKNDSGMHGVAFNSTLLALRTDDPGSCATDEGCRHDDVNIARAIDVAVANGARVINMSLGGSSANSTLRNAISRATQAGIIIVISAGNDAQANPDPLALVATDTNVSRGQVLIAGGVDSNNLISDYGIDKDGSRKGSSQAGIGANYYIAALGTRVRSFDPNCGACLYSGTSYAAPNVAGAAALLISAFPNLNAAQVIDILFRSADDLGAPGIDSQYGRGVLNLTRAFQPIGSTSLAGSAVPVSTTDANATLGGAFGDGGQLGASVRGAVILDGYDRAFAVDLAQSLAAAPASRPLAGRLVDRSRGVSVGDDKRYLYLNITPATSGRPWVGLAQMGVDMHAADRVRARYGLIASQLTAKTKLGLAYGFGAETLLGSMNGSRPDGAFITGANPLTDAGFARRSGASAALSHQLGGWSLGFAAGHATTRDPQRYGGDGAVDTVAVEASRRVGPVALTLGLAQMRESDTVLGSWSGPAFGFRGATTRFASVDARLPLGGGFSAGVGARHGWTDAKLAGGLVADVEGLRSFGFQADLSKAGLFGGDRLDLRLAQPLRVTGGVARLSVPVGYDYATRETAFDTRTASLMPSGRELDAEAAYSVAVFGGEFGAHLFWRNDPGHIDGAPDDLGAAIRFSLGF